MQREGFNHARVESDNPFYSTFDQNVISIHALRVESDNATQVLSPIPKRFNPRSPRGERLGFIDTLLPTVFQSTLSAWRATQKWNPLLQMLIISIHALRVESDCKKAQNIIT